MAVSNRVDSIALCSDDTEKDVSFRVEENGCQLMLFEQLGPDDALKIQVAIAVDSRFLTAGVSYQAKLVFVSTSTYEQFASGPTKLLDGAAQIAFLIPSSSVFNNFVIHLVLIREGEIEGSTVLRRGREGKVSPICFEATLKFRVLGNVSPLNLRQKTFVQPGLEYSFWQIHIELPDDVMLWEHWSLSRTISIEHNSMFEELISQSSITTNLLSCNVFESLIDKVVEKITADENYGKYLSTVVKKSRSRGKQYFKNRTVLYLINTAFQTAFPLYISRSNDIDWKLISEIWRTNRTECVSYLSSFINKLNPLEGSGK